jgi:hypothetical protein
MHGRSRGRGRGEGEEADRWGRHVSGRGEGREREMGRGRWAVGDVGLEWAEREVEVRRIFFQNSF